MDKHTTDIPCPACEDKKKEAHPMMISWFDRLKSKYPNVHISWYYRGKIDQNQLLSEGRSKLPWNKSAHNIEIMGIPCAQALDLFQLIDNKAIFDPGFYHEISEWCLSEKDPIFWGGNWKTLGDNDHFQLDPTKFGPV